MSVFVYVLPGKFTAPWRVAAAGKRGSSGCRKVVPSAIPSCATWAEVALSCWLTALPDPAEVKEAVKWWI